MKCAEQKLAWEHFLQNDNKVKCKTFDFTLQLSSAGTGLYRVKRDTLLSHKYEEILGDIAKYKLLLLTMTTNPPSSSCRSTLLTLVM